MTGKLLSIVGIGFALQAFAAEGVPPDSDPGRLQSLPFTTKKEGLIREITGNATFGAPSDVGNLKWSRDGKWLFASVENRNWVAQFEAATGRCERVLCLAPGFAVGRDVIIGMEYPPVPDGYQKSRLGCWNVADLKTVWRRDDLKGDVALSPDGSMVLFRSEVGRDNARVFLGLDAVSGTTQWTRSGRALGNDPVRFINDHVAGCVFNFGMFLLDTRTGSPLKELAASVTGVEHFYKLQDTYPENGSLVLMPVDGVRIWKVGDTAPAAALANLTQTPDGQPLGDCNAHFLSGGSSLFLAEHGHGRIFDLKTRRQTRFISGVGEVVEPDYGRNRVATACCSTIGIVSGPEWKSDPIPGYSHFCRMPVVTADQKTLAIACLDRVWFWSLETGKRLGDLGDETPGYYFEAICPAKSGILVSDGMEVWHVEQTPWLQHAGDPRELRSQYKRRLLSLPTDMQFRENALASGPGGLDAIALGKRVYFFKDSGTGSADPKQLEQIDRSQRCSSPVKTLKFGAGGATLAVLERDGLLDVYDVNSRTLLYGLRPTSTQHIAFAEDADLFLHSDSSAGSVLVLCELSTGKERMSFPVDTAGMLGGGRIEAAAISPDGHWIAAAATKHGSLESVIQVWDATSGEQAGSVISDHGEVRKMILLPNKQLLAFHSSSLITQWQIPDGSGGK